MGSIDCACEGQLGERISLKLSLRKPIGLLSPEPFDHRGRFGFIKCEGSRSVLCSGSAVHLAAGRGLVSMLKLLIERPGREFMTPLALAEEEKVEKVEFSTATKAPS